MSGHVQDRWWRQKRDENGKLCFDSNGRPIREKSALYGKGMRYKVRYYVGSEEKSESFPDKQLKRAQTFLSKMQTDVLTGTYVDPEAGKMRLKDYATQWRKGQSSDPISQQTIGAKLNGLVWPFFGDRFLSEITTAKIRDWLEWMQTNGQHGPTTTSYRAQVFDTLSAILSAAVEDKKILVNPCKAKSIKRPKPEERKVRPWPQTRVQTVQGVLPDIYKIVVPIGAGLGLRQMEIFGLSPDDIDRDKMEVNVVRQIRWIDKAPVFSPPKGGKSRVVPVGAGVLESIDDYMTAYEPVTVTLPWLRHGGDPMTVRLLINKAADGVARIVNEMSAQFWRADGFLLGVWKTAFRRGGVVYENRRDGVHALRHFYASNLLAQGVSIKEVSEYLGHHDPGFTLRVYTHLMPSSHQRARLASDKVFKPRALPDAA
jgi:integrase